MSLNHAPPLLARDAAPPQTSETVLWLHAGFCGMALPMRAARGTWRRDIGPLALAIEPASAEQVLPSGRLLRLALIHICDTALRSNSALVALGESPTALAESMGLDAKTRDLADQIQRLMAAKISFSPAGGPEVSMFDARSRPRADSTEWRSSLRLSGKFLASLATQAVALDRRVVRELADSPAALDAYAWIRLSLHGAAADCTLTISWADLLLRFGSASQTLAAFRPGFEGALRLVFDADPSIALAVDDEGVSLRHAMPEEAEAATDERPAVASIPEPAPVAAPEARIDRPRRAAPEAAVQAALPLAPVAPIPVVQVPVVQVPVVQIQVAEAPIAADTAEDAITQDSICLPIHLTGLPLGIWLRRGHGEDSVLVGVTPSVRFDANRLTILALEPMVVQVSGGLYQKEFDSVSAWVMANRDLIDAFWEGEITSFTELHRRVRKAPAPGWR